MIGLLALMGIALTLLLMLLTAMLAWEMVRPPRQTLAWAVARKVAADPGEVGLRFEEWWLDRLDPPPARLSVWEIEGQGPAGLTAVFLHGWGKSRITSLQRIGPFVPLVDRLVLYDLRGHGESTGSASRLGDDEDDDLLALLDRLDGRARFMLVGHSMGAVIALRAAAKARRQRSEICAQSASRAEIAGVIAYAPYLDFHRSLRGRLRAHGYPTRPLTDLATLVHRVRRVRPAYVDLKQAASIDAPLLVIHGVDDAVAPVNDARQIVKAVRGATLVEIEDAAHADAHRVDEARHDEVVREFVMKVRNRAAETCASLK